MIKQILFFILTIILISSFVCKKKEFIPPGTVKINDTLFADETEISNFSWQEYENWVKTKYGVNSTEYSNVLPDTTVWRQNNSYNEPYVQYYYRHPAYKDYPVVGVSYEQALAFCKWRIDRVRENLVKLKKHGSIEFEFRLPSKLEWELISGDCLNMFNNNGRTAKGLIAFNHRWAKDSAEWVSKDKERSGAEILAPVYSYWPNQFKLFNMIGNVAEMVIEKGVSKGGSWTNFLEECRVGKEIEYDKPTAWLGFRCVCAVKKKDNC